VENRKKTKKAEGVKESLCIFKFHDGTQANGGFIVLAEKCECNSAHNKMHMAYCTNKPGLPSKVRVWPFNLLYYTRNVTTDLQNTVVPP
jgi:hypothetical protein